MTFKATQGHWKWHESVGLGQDAYDVIKLTFYKDVDCLGACQFATAAQQPAVKNQIGMISRPT